MLKQNQADERRLPKIRQQKLINIAEFVKLAKKVRKSFEKEQEYLEQEQQHHHHSSCSQFL